MSVIFPNKTMVWTLAVIALLVVLPQVAMAQDENTSSASRITQVVSALLTVAVVIGAVYNLWRTTRAYGGIVGSGIRRVGVGIILLVVEALDRVAINLGANGVIRGLFQSQYEAPVHDIILIGALFFVTLGFVKLLSATKS